MTTYEHRVREGIERALGLQEDSRGAVTDTHSDLNSEEYVLATGMAAVHRLWILHSIYSPAGRRILLQAGLRPGMRIADFGCSVGVTTRMLGELTGPSGEVLGIDVHSAQLVQARRICQKGGLTNASFLHADACHTGLPAESFDLVYCRFLLLHLPNPTDCLSEMRRLLKPDGILVVEDGDLASAESVPPTAINAFADLFTRLAPTRGLDYSLSKYLFHMVKAANFPDPEIEIHQPAITRGDTRVFLKWSVEEARPAMIAAGLVTRGELDGILRKMQSAVENPEVLILAPRMSVVWARKP